MNELQSCYKNVESFNYEIQQPTSFPAVSVGNLDVVFAKDCIFLIESLLIL